MLDKFMGKGKKIAPEDVVPIPLTGWRLWVNRRRPLWTFRWYWSEGQMYRNHIVWWLIKPIPRSVRYWIVVKAIVGSAGPNRHPDSVTWGQIMEYYDDKPDDIGHTHEKERYVNDQPSW